MKKPETKPKTAKNMIYKIDQSGKVEYTGHDTVIAFSNGKKKAVLIRARDKRILQKYFREAGKGQIFTFRLFALLISLLLKDEPFQELIIDIEYPGRSDIIKNFLLHDFSRSGRKINPEMIRFQRVGKNCEAHWHGYFCFKGNRKPELSVTSKEVLKEVFH